MRPPGIRRIGAGNPPLHRFRIGLEFVLSGHREVDKMIDHHAAMARALGEQLELPDAVLDALGAAYEMWDGNGWPGELGGDGDPARGAARAARPNSSRSRTAWAASTRRRALARERRGKQFDPALCDLDRTPTREMISPASTRSRRGMR